MQVAEGLQKIYTDMDIAEAQREVDNIQEALEIASLTHDRLQKEFEYSRIRLEEAKNELIPVSHFRKMDTIIFSPIFPPSD